MLDETEDRGLRSESLALALDASPSDGWEQADILSALTLQAHNATNTKTIHGSAKSDVIMGTGAHELISGIAAQDSARGRGTRDVVYGGGGDDTFVLGDSRGAFYDDQSARTSGRSDYLSIRDFSSGDRIVLAGTATDYVIRSESLGRAGTGLYKDANGNRRYDGADEFIGHIAGSKKITGLTDGSFIYLGAEADPSPSPAGVISARNAKELTAALDKARGGETIILTGDDYGSVDIRRIDVDKAVTITSDAVGDLATFRSISITESSGLKLENLKVQLTHEEGQHNLEALVRVFRSSEISLDKLELRGFNAVTGVSQDSKELDASRNVIGLPVGRGVFVHESEGVSLTNSELSNLSRGVALANAEDLRIVGNEIHDLRTTGIQAAGVKDLLISSNHIYRSTPWRFGGDGDHGDYIHIWSSGDERSENANVTITGNLLEQKDGAPLLGIYVDDNSEKVGFENYTITHNVIAAGTHQAIRLENVRGVLANNTLLQTSGDEKDKPLIINASGGSLLVERNIAGGIETKDKSVSKKAGNLILQKWDKGSDHYESALKFDKEDGIDLEDAIQRIGFEAYGADLAKFLSWATIGDDNDLNEAAVAPVTAATETLQAPMSSDVQFGLGTESILSWSRPLDHFNLA